MEPGNQTGPLSPVAVAGEGDLVAEDVAGGREPSVDGYSGFGQTVEELGFVRGAGYGLADVVAQEFAGGGFPAEPLGFVAFGAGGALGGGAVALVEAAESELLLDLSAFGLGAGAVLMVAWPGSVGTDEGGNDVNVIGAVPDGDPAAGLVVALGGDAGGVKDARGDGRPLLVGQEADPRGCGSDAS